MQIQQIIIVALLGHGAAAYLARPSPAQELTTRNPKHAFPAVPPDLCASNSCKSTEDCHNIKCGSCNLAIDNPVCNPPGLNLFVLDCSQCPRACNNDCYGVFYAGKDAILHYPGPDSGATADRRKAAGCLTGKKDPCKNPDLKKYQEDGNSCDEYPYASTTNGGKGAVLRCIPYKGDNKREGELLSGFLSRAKNKGGCGGEDCKFSLVFINTSDSPFCKQNPPSGNDGQEFTYEGDGKYVDAPEENSKAMQGGSTNTTASASSVKRREFLLSDGRHAVIFDSANTPDFVGRAVTEEFGEFGSTTIAQELF